MSLKAFVVQAPKTHLGNLSELVFAETAGRARHLALKYSNWFSYSDLSYTDLTVKREPKADDWAHLNNHREGVLDFEEKHSQLFKGVLGWEEIEI